MMNKLFSQNFIRRFDLKVSEITSKILIIKNKYMYHIFITHTSGLNFVMKICGDDLLNVNIISTKFHKKIHTFNFQTKLY